jgi:hypothetical protein
MRTAAVLTAVPAIAAAAVGSVAVADAHSGSSQVVRVQESLTPEPQRSPALSTHSPKCPRGRAPSITKLGRDVHLAAHRIGEATFIRRMVHRTDLHISSISPIPYVILDGHRVPKRSVVLVTATRGGRYDWKLLVGTVTWPHAPFTVYDAEFAGCVAR